MVISTGMMFPRWDSVAALYCLTNTMMLTPCGPSAVPTGGAGVAWPAGSCTLTSAAIFFFGGICSFSGSFVNAPRTWGDELGVDQRRIRRAPRGEDRAGTADSGLRYRDSHMRWTAPV